MNNENAFRTICAQLDDAACPYNLVLHGPTRTSEDSARARAEGGYPDAVGAKALLVKAELKIGIQTYLTLVLPSRFRIDTRTVRSSLPELRRFRFVTAEEMAGVVQLTPGCMPPFGPSIFEAVSALYVDPRLAESEQIGFNPARMETSIILASKDYLEIASPNAIVSLTNGETLGNSS